MKTSTTVLVMMLILFVQLSQEGVIKLSHKKPITIKIQAKPSVLIKKPFPLMFLKKPLPILLLKRHHFKFRKGWPLSAFFTFKAVKYAKLAFLTSLVKKRRRRSLTMPATSIAGHSTRTWLKNERLNLNAGKSVQNFRSSEAFQLDLRAHTTLPQKYTVETKHYPIFADAVTVSPRFEIVLSRWNESQTTTMKETKKKTSRTTSSPSLQGPHANFVLPANASYVVDPVRSAATTIIYFNSRSHNEKEFLGGILGINSTGKANINSTTPPWKLDEGFPVWTASLDSIPATTMSDGSVKQTTANYKARKWWEAVVHSGRTTIQPRLTTQPSAARTVVDDSKNYLSEEFEDHIVNLTLSSALEEITTWPSFSEFDISNTSHIETKSSSEFSHNSSKEPLATAPYKSQEIMIDSPFISVMTSISKLTTTNRLPVVVTGESDISITKSVSAEATTKDLPAISIKTVLGNIATPFSEDWWSPQFDQSPNKVIPGFGMENQNSSARKPIRPSVVGGFEFSFDPNGYSEQKSNRSNENTTSNAASIEGTSNTTLPVFYFAEVKLDDSPYVVTNASHIIQEYANKTLAPTEVSIETTSSALDIQQLSTVLRVASITTPIPRSKSALLEADVTKMLNEVYSFESQSQQYPTRHPSMNYTISNTMSFFSALLPLATTGLPSQEVEGFYTRETGIIYDKNMIPTVEGVQSAKRQQTSLKAQTSTNSKNGSGKSNVRAFTRVPEKKVIKRVSETTSKSTFRPSFQEAKDDDIDEIFKSLRANDQHDCILRAICELEAIKKTKKLSVNEESFVDLFGTTVSEPNEEDRNKESYPFHRAAFIGNNYQNPTLCAHTYRSCANPPVTLLSFFTENKRQSANVMPVTVFNTKPRPGVLLAGEPPVYPSFGLPNGQIPAFNNGLPSINSPFPLPPGGIPAKVPPNVNVRQGSKAIQFPDGTLLIMEPPAGSLPNTPTISHPKPSPPLLPGQLPTPKSMADNTHRVPIEQIILPAYPHRPAVFETEVTFSADGDGISEVLPKIPKVFDNGIKLTPQVIALINHLVKYDLRRLPNTKHNDFIRDIVKEVVIGHIHKQFHKPWMAANHSFGYSTSRLLPSPPSRATVPAPAASGPTHPSAFPVAPPVISKTSAKPSVSSTPATIPTPAPCAHGCCNCLSQIVKHIHNNFDKTTSTATKPTKKTRIHKNEPFLVIEKEPFRLEIGR